MRGFLLCSSIIRRAITSETLLELRELHPSLNGPAHHSSNQLSSVVAQQPSSNRLVPRSGSSASTPGDLNMGSYQPASDARQSARTSTDPPWTHTPNSSLGRQCRLPTAILVSHFSQRALHATNCLYMPQTVFTCHKLSLRATNCLYMPQTVFTCHKLYLRATNCLYVPRTVLWVRLYTSETDTRACLVCRLRSSCYFLNNIRNFV